MHSADIARFEAALMASRAAASAKRQSNKGILTRRNSTSNTGERVFHSALSTERVYLAGLFEYLPWGNVTIPERRRRRLQQEFEAQSEQARRKAQRKLKFVKAAEALMGCGQHLLCAHLPKAVSLMPMALRTERGRWR